MRNTRLWVVLAVVVIGLFNIEVPTVAKGDRPLQPDDFWWAEFWSGQFGAVVGGALGLGVVYTSCNSFGFESACASLRWIASTLTGSKSLHFNLDLAVVEPAFRTINMGRGLGALTGVVLTGWIRGVEGNILAAYLAANLWFFASTVVPYVAVPGLPAFVVTVAYNWGAKMKVDKTRPAALGWSLPLVERGF